MNKKALKTTGIEAFALSSSTARDKRRQRVSHDEQEHLPQPETGRSAARRWPIDTLALAGAWMAGVYVGVWLDPPNSNPNPVDTEETK
jgi:hypothetical protein